MALRMMLVFTYLSCFVIMVFRGMLTVWRGRHRLIFCWLVFMQAVHPGRKSFAPWMHSLHEDQPAENEAMAPAPHGEHATKYHDHKARKIGEDEHHAQSHLYRKYKETSGR